MEKSLRAQMKTPFFQLIWTLTMRKFLLKSKTGDELDFCDSKITMYQRTSGVSYGYRIDCQENQWFTPRMRSQNDAHSKIIPLSISSKVPTFCLRRSLHPFSIHRYKRRLGSLSNIMGVELAARGKLKL